MSQRRPYICLYLDNVANIQEAIDLLNKSWYSRIVLRATNQLLGHRCDENEVRTRISTRSDLLLEAEQWRRNTILKIDDFGDLDSKNVHLQRQSEHNLEQEIKWIKHLDSMARIMVALRNDESLNLARQLMYNFDSSGCVFVELPLIDPSFYKQNYTKRRKILQMSVAADLVWQRWNTFRSIVQFNRHVEVALELDKVLPNEGDVNRWLGEPVGLIIVPSYLFRQNKNNYGIHLEDCYKEICITFMNRTNANFAVRCANDDPWLDEYPVYIRNFLYAAQKNDTTHECNDLLYCGLKLTKNFSINKCAKYQHKMNSQYARAIRLAIDDRLQMDEKVRLMICGANGWTLLEPVMSIIGDSNAIDIFIFETDPCVRITITEAIEHLYSDRNTSVVIVSDVGNSKHHGKMDIVVSITFETIYESQWLQNNFDQVQSFVRANVIKIPNKSSITIQPVTAAMAHTELQADDLLKYKPSYQEKQFDNCANRTEIICSLFSRNVYSCADARELFLFDHTKPSDSTDDSRMEVIEFNIDRKCNITGFGGYFRIRLYKDVILDNRRWCNDRNIDCIPMVYLPMTHPLTLDKQVTLKANFWYHSNLRAQSHWYEWQTTDPIISQCQNLKGHACTLRA